MLRVDGAGIVRSANSSAERFWLAAAGELSGRSLSSLLHAATPAPGVDDWAALTRSALNATTTCDALLPEGTTASVQFRLEEAHGESDMYFAWVQMAEPISSPNPPVLVDTGLALLADRGAVGFFDLNFKAEQVYYSPAWKRMLGYTETDLANTYDSWLRLLHPEDSAAAPDHASRKQLRGIKSFSVEVRMLHRRGHHVWVHCLGTQVYGPYGDLERVTGLQIDISERKDAEEQSLLNDERVQRLSLEGELALFDFNFPAQEFWLSGSWSGLTGTDATSGAAALSAFVEALPPELALRGAQAFFVEPNVGRPTFLQALRLRRVNGADVDVIFGAHRQLSRKGDLTRVVGFCCPLPHGLVELAATPFPASLVDPVLGTLSEAVVIADGRGEVFYINERAARLTGYENASACGLSVEQVFRLVDASSGTPCRATFETILAACEEGRLNGDNALLVWGEETPRPIVWSARRVESAEGAARAIIVVFRDPEEMNLTPEELLRINRFETLGVVAGGISHDFNNLLTTILGGISQAKDNKDYNYLADAERACMAAKALTKQLLAIAKGGKSEAIQTLAAAEVIRDAVRLSRAGTAADIRIEIPDSVSAFSADRAQILQVFQNLIINALQAIPARGGKLILAGENVALGDDEIERLPAGNYVRIDVRDNGCGIAPENLERIFEPFFTTKKHGTGLGLSMVRSLARKFGGEVAVSSIVGDGTTFHVYLPAGAARSEVAETRRAPSLRFGTGRVLLMDDDPDICRLADGMLASLDYKYDIVRNGEEAIALYRRYLNVGRPYDAVILDLTVVGGAGGEETFHQLRALDADVRAIVCSGYDSEDMIRHYLEMGFCGYLTKPFRVGDLGKALKSVVG